MFGMTLVSGGSESSQSSSSLSTPMTATSSGTARPRRRQAGGANVNDWDGNIFEGGGDGRIFNARDDAMPVPMREPGRRLIAAIMFGEIKGPRTMFANVGNDAAQQTAGVSVRGLDQ